MKKYLLKLGVIGIAALPLLSLTSCNNESLKAIDLEINIPKDKNVTQADINAVSEELQVEGIFKERKIELLNQIFDNVNEEKFNYFKIKTGQNPFNTSQQIISLEANDGFVFKNKKVLRSQEVKIPPKEIYLNIQALGGIDQPIIDQAIIKLNSVITLEEKVWSLNTIFRGVTIDNLNNFDIQAIPTSDKILGRVILTAKSGFSFNGKPTLSSSLKWNLEIQVIPKLQKYIDHVIKRWNEDLNIPSEKVAILSIIFEGVNEENINNFSVQAVPTSGSTLGKVTLTANPDFSFNSYFQTLISETIPEVDLGPIIQPILKTQEEIDNVIIIWNNTLAISEKVRILSTIFQGITLENINHFNVEVIPTSGTTLGKVNLVAKEGFSFYLQPTLSSNAIVDLTIGHELVDQGSLDNAINLLNNPEVEPYQVLPIAFTGINQENVNHLNITATPTSGENLGTILLTAKEGFSINGKPSLLSSITKTDLKINAIRKTQEDVDNVIRSWNNALSNPEKVIVLSTIFGGITQENINHFNVEAIPTSGTTPGKVTLIAKQAFTINGNPSLSSSLKFNLSITAIPKLEKYIQNVIIGWNENLIISEKVRVLSTIFEGVNEENIDNFTVEITPTVGSTIGKVTLIAKSQFIFDGKYPNLTSIGLPEIDLGPIIKAFPREQIIMEQAISLWSPDLDIAGKVRTLTMIFSGVTEENVDRFDVEVTPSFGNIPGKFTLIGKEGVSFGSQPRLESKINLRIEHERIKGTNLDLVIAFVVDTVNPSPDQLLIELSKVFKGLDNQILNYIDVNSIKTDPNPPWSWGKIVLTAKQGFAINGKDVFVSDAYDRYD